MTDKLSYMDLLMYVLPGAVLIVDGLAGAALVASDAVGKLALFGEGGLFASVVFVLMSFVAGNALQVFAHLLPERLLRFAFWSGHWASQLALLEGGPALSSSHRRAVKTALSSLGLADATALSALSANVTRRWGWWRIAGAPTSAKASLEVAQACFNRGRSLLADCGAGQRAGVAESYYQFFRGLFAATLIGAAGFGILSVTASWKARVGLPADAIPGAGLLAIMHIGVAGLFGWRARGAGEGFVREVYLALSVLDSTKKLGSNSPATSPTA